MKYIKKFDMSYTEPEMQYDSTDFMESDIVEAEYVPVIGYEGKPDIEALPKPFTGLKAVKEGIYIPPVLTKEGANKHLKIYSMRDVRFPMINQGEINKRIYEGMVSSYAERAYAVTERPVKLKRNDEEDGDIEISILASTYMNGETKSSGLVGLPGTGKSTALNIALKKYPRAIKHTFEGGHYIQIPIIRTTAYANSNISALFISFANTIDDILDCGSRHRDELKSSNIGRMTERIINWIRRYHIGCWIIEEAEFFSFGTEKSSSFENIVTIMQETGVFLFATGNHDLMAKLDGNLRQERRLLANYIDMDLIPQDKECMRMITGQMWEYILPEMKAELTDEMFEEIYFWTLGSIDMISILLVSLQQEYVSRRKKGAKNIKVTTEFIKSVAKAKLTRMRKLFLDGQTSAAVDAYRQAQKEFNESIEKDKQIIENAKVQAELKEEIAAGYNHYQKYCMVKDSILMVMDEFSDSKIKSAFAYCETNIDNFKHMTNKEMVRVVFERLNHVKCKTKEKRDKKVAENLEEFQKNLLGENKEVTA